MEATGHEAEAKFQKEDAVAPNPSYVYLTWNTPRPRCWKRGSWVCEYPVRQWCNYLLRFPSASTRLDHTAGRHGATQL